MKSILLLLLASITLWADAHIFVYHRFGDSRHPSTNTTVEQLRAEFEHLKTNGYKVVPLHKLITALKEKQEIPDKWVVLTVDDSFKSFYTNGLPIFKEYDYPFSLFVYVEATQKGYSDFMSWEQLRELKPYGSLEFHSYSHGHMTRMSNSELKEDFEKGLKLFTKELSIEPKAFSYPFGEYSPRVKQIAKSYGFDTIMNQNMGAVSEFSDIYDIDRSALVGKSNLVQYLKYRTLKSNWKEPTIFPEDSILKTLHVETDERAKNGGVAISGHKWMLAKLENGDFKMELNKKLIKKRTRIVISVGNKISTKLLIKDKYEN